MDQETHMRTVAEFLKNTRNLPAEFSLRYANKHIAWNLEGTQVLAEGDTEEEVNQKLWAAGIDLLQTVASYVPDPNVSLL